MVHFGQYIPSASVLHRLDPRVKILSTLLLSILVLRAGFPEILGYTAFLLVLVPVSHLPARHALSIFKPVAPFFLILFLLHLLFTKGTPLSPFPAWIITPTREGLAAGLLVIWQFALLVLSASYLTLSTSPTDLISGLERLLRPFGKIGVPSHEVALMVSLALRFVPTVLEEIRTIKEAQVSRGATASSGSLTRRARTIVALLVPLFLNTIRRAEELATAMEGRGYSGGPRTSMRELRFTRADLGAALVLVCVAGLLSVTP